MANRAVVAGGTAVLAGGVTAGVVYYLSTRQPPAPVPAEDLVRDAEVVAPPLEAQIEALEAAVQGMTEALQRAEATIAELEATIAQQDQTIAELEQAVVDLQERVGQLQAILDELTRSASALAQQNAQALALAEALDREYGERDARFRQLLDLIREQEQTIAQLREQIARLQQQVELLQAQVAQLEQLVAQLREQNRQLQALVQQLQAQLAAAQQQIEALNRAIADLRYQLELIPVRAELNLEVMSCGTGDRWDERPFFIPYDQQVKVIWTVQAQTKCLIDMGFGGAMIHDDASRRFIFVREKGSCSNCADSNSTTLNLKRGSYRIVNRINPPGRAYLRVEYLMPRFLVG